MAYATAQDMADRYGLDALSAVADREGDGSMDPEAIDGALADASGEIDSYLSVRYPLPLSETPGIVTRYCVDMAMYHLSGNRTTEEVEKRYRTALAWLRDVSAGRAGLGENPTEAAGGGASFFADDRRMTRTELKGGF